MGVGTGARSNWFFVGFHFYTRRYGRAERRRPEAVTHTAPLHVLRDNRVGWRTKICPSLCKGVTNRVTEVTKAQKLSIFCWGVSAGRQ